MASSAPTWPAGNWQTLIELRTAISTAAGVLPCRADPEAWSSSSPHPAEEAAAACAPCPVLQPCRRHVTAHPDELGTWGRPDTAGTPGIRPRVITTTTKKEPNLMPEFSKRPVGRGGDQRWLGSAHALTSARSAVLDVSAFDPEVHFPNGYVPSGLPVNAADVDALKPYTGAAGERLRFVKDNHELAGAEDLNVATIWHGLVHVDRLVVALPEPDETDRHQFTFEGDDFGGQG